MSINLRDWFWNTSTWTPPSSWTNITTWNLCRSSPNPTVGCLGDVRGGWTPTYHLKSTNMDLPVKKIMQMVAHRHALYIYIQSYISYSYTLPVENRWTLWDMLQSSHLFPQRPNSSGTAYRRVVRWACCDLPWQVAWAGNEQNHPCGSNNAINRRFVNGL